MRMPRTYVTNLRGKWHLAPNHEILSQAVDDVILNGLSYRKAAERHGKNWPVAFEKGARKLSTGT